MKAKINNNTYDILSTSCFNGKLILTIVGDKDYDYYNEKLSDNSGVVVINDKGKFINRYDGYNTVISATLKKDYVIEPPTYDEDGDIEKEAVTSDVVVVTLLNDGKQEEKEIEPTPTIGELMAQVSEMQSQVEYLLMIMEG